MGPSFSMYIDDFKVWAALYCIDWWFLRCGPHFLCTITFLSLHIIFSKHRYILWVMSTKCEMHSKYLTSSKLGLIWARHKNLGKWLIWHNIRWKFLAFFKVWKFNYGVSSVNNCMCVIRYWVGLTTLHIYLMWFLHLTSTLGVPVFTVYNCSALRIKFWIPLPKLE